MSKFETSQIFPVMRIFSFKIMTYLKLKKFCWNYLLIQYYYQQYYLLKIFPPKKGEVIMREKFRTVAYLAPLIFVLKSKKHCNLDTRVTSFNTYPFFELVCFRNRHQCNVTFRHRYSIIFWVGGWKGDQILKYRFSFTVMRKMFLELYSFVSIRYVICFKIK